MITFKSHQAIVYLKPHLPDQPTIVEAGAYKGKETIALATQIPASTVHAFEPVPAIFAQLEENTKTVPNIHRYQCALSDTTGTTTLHISEHPDRPGIPSQGNSVLAPQERLNHSPLVFPQKLEVPCITLDDWAQRHNIDHVDLVWLDLQGHELAVLKSSPNILRTVRVIYTEVEFIQAYENQPQYPEVKAWLESQGFTMIGKDFTDHPTWFFGNALFVKNELLNTQYS